ncbi:MAG: hypothetical protein AB1798_16785, partial [Spirochaetota bacterium]
MRILDNLLYSSRYVKMRFLESFLAVLGITLSVGIISAAITLIQTYNRKTEEAMNAPYFREITVSGRGSEPEIKVPILRVGNIKDKQVQLEMEALLQAKQECPAASFGYLNVFEDFNTAPAQIFTFPMGEKYQGSGGKAPG